MVTEVNRRGVQQLVAQGAALVDVLERSEFDDSHLPDAIHIPLPRLGETALLLLDATRPTIVYCYDSKCDLSPRGAARLETLGFRDVYDYVASKVDWMGAGLPFEGTRAREPMLAGLADRKVPTCRLDERTRDVRERVGEWPVCVVVNERNVVLGVLDGEAMVPADAAVAAVMKEGPRTFRPHTTAVEAAHELEKKSLPWMLVSNLDGTLVGLADSARVRQSASGSRSHVNI